jgi:hypothetical protein
MGEGEELYIQHAPVRAELIRQPEPGTSQVRREDHGDFCFCAPQRSDQREGIGLTVGPTWKTAAREQGAAPWTLAVGARGVPSWAARIKGGNWAEWVLLGPTVGFHLFFLYFHFPIMSPFYFEFQI